MKKLVFVSLLYLTVSLRSEIHVVCAVKFKDLKLQFLSFENKRDDTIPFMVLLHSNLLDIYMI